MSKRDSKSKDTLVDVQSAYSKTEQYVEKNRNPILIIAGIMVVLFAGYFGYTRLYLFPKSQEGMEMLWKAEYWFEIDSLDKALHGNESYYGFEYIADSYSSTKAGALAAYYAGVIHLKQGDYPRAIAYLKNADLDDKLAGAVALGGIGDAYVELGNFNQALTYFDRAVKHSDNPLTAPVYLKKAGLVLEEMEKFADARAKYQSIKDNYPKSPQAQDIDSYIARVGG